MKDTINELVVLVSNEISRGAWWSWGGISRNVSIHQYNDVKIDRFMISSIPDFENGKATFSLSSQLENLEAVSKKLQVEVVFEDPAIPSIKSSITLGKNEIGIDEHWTDMRMSKEQFRYVSSMLHHIKTSLDSTRLLTYASFTAFRAKANPETDPAGLCDFISFNSYGNVVDNCVQVNSKWPDKPIFIAEFGRGMIGENLNTSDILPVVYNLMNKVKEFPYLIGASLWTFNDYRSRYSGTTPSENRSWGVVDVWRNPKIATKSIRELFVPVKNFNVRYNKNKLNITFLGRNPEVVPGISLKNYYVQVLSAKGEKSKFPLSILQREQSLFNNIGKKTS